MVHKRVIFFILLCAGICTATSARGFFGLAWRAGVFYATYKLIDGLSDGALSRFVDRNIDAPLDAIYSFGKGVKTFGFGIRNVATTFAGQNGDKAFSQAWNGLQREYEHAVVVAKKDWSERREIALARKAIEAHQVKALEPEQKKQKKESRAQLDGKATNVCVVAKRKRRKGSHGFRQHNNGTAVA